MSSFRARILALALAGATGALAPAAWAGPEFAPWGFDLTGMDRSASPGDDFYAFSNGAWYARTEIPADRVRFGMFDRLQALSETRTRTVDEAAAAGRLDDPDAAKIGAAYAAFMDEGRVEALDARPLAPDLERIRAERTRADVAALMGAANSGFRASVIGVDISPDLKASDRYAVWLGPAGLGLPDRDYYLKPEFAAKKAAYLAYVKAQLAAIGWPDPDGAANAVLAFETRLAGGEWTRAQSRQIEALYHPMTRAELSAYAPGFDFDAFLGAAGLGSDARLIAAKDTALQKTAAVFAESPVPVLQAWQAFHLVDAASPYLSRRFADAHFEFHRHVLAGQPTEDPRWRRAVRFTDEVIGESVGRAYVKAYFPPDSKAKIDAIVTSIRVALRARIARVAWMSPETRAEAFAKLDRLNVKIGYPSKWRDYAALTLGADDLYGDAARGAAFDWARQLARRNGPVDQTEWGLTPQTVNAYYSPSHNEIVFPAAILQPPFFDAAADLAVNYGGIGVVIGHELTHGFDDQGRKTDGAGTLRDWWTSADASRFTAATARLGAQASTYEPFPGTHVNGALTMGENIADLGGVLTAYDAYHAALGGAPAPKLDGLSGDQRFFLGFAQVWREKIREDAARQLIVVDPHAPARLRVIGALRNVDAWYDAFGVKPGDRNYIAPDARVRIW